MSAAGRSASLVAVAVSALSLPSNACCSREPADGERQRTAKARSQFGCPRRCHACVAASTSWQCVLMRNDRINEYYTGAAFYDLEDVATDGSAVRFNVEILFFYVSPGTCVGAVSCSRHTQVAFSQFEGKVCFAQNVASA